MELFLKFPNEVQKDCLMGLLDKAKNTEYDIQEDMDMIMPLVDRHFQETQMQNPRYNFHNLFLGFCGYMSYDNLYIFYEYV